MVQRVGGLISGLDTDSLVKALTLAQQSKIDKLKQQNTVGTWQQTEYRTIINKLNDFQSKYFSASNPLTNLKSASAITQYVSSITNAAGTSSSAVSVSASGSVKNAAHTLSVQQLAQKETWQGGTPVKAQGSGLDMAAVNAATSSGSGLTLAVKIDGQTKAVTVKGTYGENDQAKFAEDLQKAMDNTFGSGKVKVGTTNDKTELTFATADANGKSNGHSFAMDNVAGGNTTIMKSLGFNGMTSTTMDVNKKLSELSFANGATTSNGMMEFTINGNKFSFDPTKATMQDVFNTVNNSNAGVRMYYSEINNAVVMESKNAGEANTINWSDGNGGMMSSLFGVASSDAAKSAAATAAAAAAGAGSGAEYDKALEAELSKFIKTKAQDSIFTLDGMKTTRSSNVFEVEGITYTLNEVTTDSAGKGGELKINLTQDTSKARQLIVDFVKDYNELVKYMNDKTREEKVSGYDPLSDDQKSAMTEYEIKLWDEQAKTGLLRNDPMLRDLMNKMSNSVFMAKGEGGISAYSIGIMQTGSYSDGGQIKLDLDALDRALRDNPNAVESFFTGAKGLAGAMSDAISKAASTDILSQGSLVKKAGVQGKSSEYFNEISAASRDRNTQIEKLLEALAKKQNDLYSRYAKMESTMNTMQQQLSSLMSALG